MASNNANSSAIEQRQHTNAMMTSTLCECGREALKESCLGCGVRSCRRCAIEKIKHQKSARCGKCFARFTPLNLLFIAGTKFIWSAEYRNIRLHDVGYEEMSVTNPIDSRYVIGTKRVWLSTNNDDDDDDDERAKDETKFEFMLNDYTTKSCLNRLSLHVIDLHYVEKEFRVYVDNKRQQFTEGLLDKKSLDEITLFAKDKILFHRYDAVVKQTCASEMRKIFLEFDKSCNNDGDVFANEVDEAFARHVAIKKMRDVSYQANAITSNLMRACCQLNAHEVSVNIQKRLIRLRAIVFDKSTYHHMTQDAMHAYESFFAKDAGYFACRDWYYVYQVDPVDDPMCTFKRSTRMFLKEIKLDGELRVRVQKLNDEGVRVLTNDLFKIDRSIFGQPITYVGVDADETIVVSTPP